MPLAQRLAELVQACFTGIWIESHEHDDALQEIATLCRQEEWRLLTWDIDQGLNLQAADQIAVAETGTNDPLAAIRALSALQNEGTSSTLLVLKNFHRFLQSAEIVQALLRQLSSGKQNRTFVVILSPVVQVPTELEKQILVIEHDLPDREQLGSIARGIATDAGELPRGAELQRLLDAAAGLTRYEAENAFSLSLVRHGKLQVETLWELKSQMLKKSGLMQLYRGGESFSELGGLDSLKSFCKRALRTRPTSEVRPRGVLLLSPPGCGKSQFCKSLGNETGRPTLVLDIGSLVGQTEGKIKLPQLYEIDGGKPFAFAGLWGPEKSDDPPLESCTIITTDANELARQVHHRMPVILDPPDYDAWLDPANQDVAYMLDGIPPDRMTVRPVSTFVNNARHEGEECVAPLA